MNYPGYAPQRRLARRTPRLLPYLLPMVQGLAETLARLLVVDEQSIGVKPDFATASTRSSLTADTRSSSNGKVMMTSASSSPEMVGAVAPSKRRRAFSLKSILRTSWSASRNRRAMGGAIVPKPGCVRLTDVSVVGESPTERKGSHHFHREPCACHREVSGEASVAACAGQAIEPRNRLCRMRRDFPGNRRQHFSAAFG